MAAIMAGNKLPLGIFAYAPFMPIAVYTILLI